MVEPVFVVVVELCEATLLRCFNDMIINQATHSSCSYLPLMWNPLKYVTNIVLFYFLEYQ